MQAWDSLFAWDWSAGARWRFTGLTCPGPGHDSALAVVFLVFGIWALWFGRKPRMPLAFAAAFLVVLTWWWLIPPSDDRDWREEVAVKPRVEIDGDRVLIRNVRNFDFPQQG